MKSPEVDRINILLLDRYGATLGGLPHFRIVWSESEFETRVGDFNEFTTGGIFIRRYHGAKKVRKYNYIRYRWILEMWKLMAPMPEIPEPDGFEPIFVFESKDGLFLPPLWSVCEIICHTILNPIMDESQIRDYIAAQEGKQEAKDREYFYELFDMTPISSLLHTHEAVSLKKGVSTNKNGE